VRSKLAVKGGLTPVPPPSENEHADSGASNSVAASAPAAPRRRG